MLTVEGDVTKPATCDRTVAEAMGASGASTRCSATRGCSLSKPFTDYTAQDCTRAVAVNLTAFFHLTQRVAACMMPRRTGHIVTITQHSVSAPIPARDQCSLR